MERRLTENFSDVELMCGFLVCARMHVPTHNMPSHDSVIIDTNHVAWHTELDNKLLGTRDCLTHRIIDCCMDGRL